MFPRAVILVLLAPLALVPLLAGCSEDVPPAALGDAGFRLEAIGGTFQQPVFLGNAGDGSGDLFVAEQRGIVQVRHEGAWGVFLDVSDKVREGGEQGFLGLAFHPEYETNGRLFVHYTDTGGDTTVSELRRLDATHADPASERVLLHVDDPYENHNGGMLAFGPEGFLHIAIGDGGAANDPQNRAQGFETLMGKILRVDVDSVCGDDGLRPEAAYCIPSGNPFAARQEGREVWVYGLRNPWRFSFDRQTGDLWIGDVGQADYEEIDLQRAGSGGGENYGWSRFEGRHLKDADREAPGAVGPVAEYDHDGPPAHCAVTGGYVYRGSAIPALQGAYVFGDYCSGVLWTLRPDAGEGEGHTMTQVLDTPHHISSFGEDEAGEVYVVDHAGTVLRLIAVAT
ncbi:MAG TPA: PQQ-dependent sugar dehydrogenase [Candidatus Thermoplasmatota archaeon]|nr:PQQ-dependent sugar dehydrogenase [Candidatus Thermoplasmatota archaeon]